MGNEQAVEAGSLSFSGTERLALERGPEEERLHPTAEMPGADVCWLLRISIPKKSAHAGSTSSFS
jgi:hypothetical protein